jgi:cytochrome c-type biogenesis protein CcmH
LPNEIFMTASLASLKTQLQQLKELLDSGVLPADQYAQSKALLERRILDAVLSDTADEADAQAPLPAIAVAPDGAVAAAPQAAAANGATPIPSAQRTAPQSPPSLPSGTSGSKPSALLMVLLVAVVVAVAAGGYLWKRGGQPQADAGAPTEAAAGDQAATPHPTTSEQIAAMVDKLAQRMKEQPNDAEGWAMLARSYSVLGRHPEALVAYEKAVALRKDDPTLLADYADSLAVKNNHKLDGEPMKLVERALKLDPKNIKALSLAGTAAFDRKDYAGAVKQWEKVVAIGPADNAFVQQLGPAIDEARQLAGLPAASRPLDGAPAASDTPVAATGSTVSGTVTLSATLAKQAKPEDTVFVFARPAPGTGMPLAILRKQVKDLPLDFTLDDSMAMSPANALSGSKKVVVSARVSKSGNAMPQPGDLSGQSAEVSVGAKGLRIEIRDVVKP